jgi:hypothetical protein
MKNDQGQMVPAVLVFTKRGQIFALDRRSGEPIAKVDERPVPTTGGIPENTVSPTQPYSSLPNIGAGRLSEASSWGMTMFDQLMCRISFKQMRYDGDFTQPGLDWSISSPGALGGMNWGSASYDPENRRLFVNDIRLVNTRRIIPRAEYEAIAKVRPPTPDGHGLAAMEGTPYGVLTGPGTFSAAISTTGYLKQAAPDRVFIVGEPVGDRMMFWAESPPSKLPVGSGLINLATERHDYTDGCRAYSDCHPNVQLVPISLPTFAPDIVAPWTIEAYLAGRDPGMEAVATALR